uniref:valine--tRNA ligase n=1 Tax=Haptolina ericina TaxID=156174 RepID=A0A7S3APW0_9EUKA
MNAPFPVPGAVSAWKSDAAEEAMEIVLKVAGSIRSLRSTYLKGPLEKHAPAIYIVARRPEVAAIVSSQVETICALAKSSKTPPPASVQIVPEGCPPPRGCATDIVDQTTEVHILLQGVVDFSKEVARLQKEEAGLLGRIEKLKKKMEAPSYADKCPPSQKAEDAEKASEMQAEHKTILAAIANFQTSA